MGAKAVGDKAAHESEPNALLFSILIDASGGAPHYLSRGAASSVGFLGNFKGRIVLKAVLCGNGSVSEISAEDRLPFGLTERIIEALSRLQFQPAELNSKPVSVMIRQEFVCDTGACKAVVKP